MKEQKFALLGLLGPLVAFLFIIVSIFLVPWFSWESNALSDLGQSVSSEVAPIFNFGILLGGFLITIYSITIFRKYNKYTSYFLALSGLCLQLVGTFDEVYGWLHTQVSILFFASIGIASIVYYFEKHSIVALLALVIGVISWITYGLNIYDAGIAVPEIISAGAIAVWVMLTAIQIYVKRE
jgi:hypothetical membrane protein